MAVAENVEHADDDASRGLVHVAAETSTMREAVGTAVAVAVMLLGSKLFKAGCAVLLTDAGDGLPVRKRLFQCAALAVVIPLLWLAVARLALVSRRVLTAVGCCVALMPLGAFVLAKLGVDQWRGLHKFVSIEEALSIFRGDVGVVLIFAGLLLFLLTTLPQRMHRAALRMMQVVAFLIVVLAGLELVYFISTGFPGDGFLLHYWFAHFSNLAFIVRNELQPRNCIILAMVTALVPFFAWMFRRTPLDPRWETHPRRRMIGPLLIGVGLTFGFSPGVPPERYLYALVAPQFHVSAVHDLLEDPYWAVLRNGGLSQAPPPPLANTASLRFAPTDKTRRLNVVLVILESTRSRSITPYNPSIPNTPFLAELAEHSLQVDDMYSVIAATARAWTAILTGLYPVTSSVSSWSDSQQTKIASLPRLLRPMGYHSAFFTPAHLRFEKDAALIKNRGFDLVQCEDDYDTRGFERSNYFGFEDRVMLAPSIAWVDQARRDGNPFLLTFMTLTGHHDYHTPTTYPKQRFSDESEDLNNYLNALHYIDEWLRDLVHSFEERGLLESTMFVILGDHGESFSEHGFRQHIGVMYDEALHIPGLLYAPALWPKGGHISGLRQQIDVLPTIADALGFEMRDGFLPGRSMLQDVPADRSLYFSSWQENLSLGMRKGNRKYIYFFRRSPLQVFDISTDPLERHDLAPELAPGEADGVERSLLLWRQQAVDSFLDQH